MRGSFLTAVNHCCIGTIVREFGHKYLGSADGRVFVAHTSKIDQDVFNIRLCRLTSGFSSPQGSNRQADCPLQDSPNTQRIGRKMGVRGIRGATTVENDVQAEIHEATREMLEELLRANGISDFEEVGSIIFTTSPDLTSTFPAEAARAIGMSQVPLLCASEIAVPGSMPQCIRVLLNWNTDKKQGEIVHVYLREAKRLRPDVASAQ
jgi:chorismate mutase